MIKRYLEKYQGYKIEFNRCPHLFKHKNEGFAWAFNIYSDAYNLPISHVFFASMMGPRTEEYINKALELGKSRVHSLIDDGEFEEEHHCYLWDPDRPGPDRVTKEDCDEILKPYTREVLPPLARCKERLERRGGLAVNHPK